MLMAQKGAQIYDGSLVGPYQQEVIRDVMAKLTAGSASEMCATMYDHNYYIALPTNGSTHNNAVLILNGTDGSWLLRTDIYVESWLATEEGLFFTSSTTPGRVWKWRENLWDSITYEPTSDDVIWVTPWADFSVKKMTKGGFDVYLTCETRGQPVTLNITIETEKKSKTKQVTFNTVGWARQKHVRFGGSGRRFRMKISAPAGTPAWRIIGGIQVVVETEGD